MSNLYSKLIDKYSRIKENYISYEAAFLFEEKNF